jgi:hypothetical protein
MAVTMLAASMAAGYDFHGGAISDLGMVPETRLLFNVAGWLLFPAVLTITRRTPASGRRRAGPRRGAQP